VVTSIKQSPVLKGHLFSCPVIEKVIRIELLLRGHLSYKATFSFTKGDLLIQVWLYLPVLFTWILKKRSLTYRKCGIPQKHYPLWASQSGFSYYDLTPPPFFVFAHSRFDSKIICFNTFHTNYFNFPYDWQNGTQSIKCHCTPEEWPQIIAPRGSGAGGYGESKKKLQEPNKITS